jgi:poly(A) polymerase
MDPVATSVTGDWLTRWQTQEVMGMLTSAGHRAYVVGGCVRNALLGAPVSDIDISTDAPPATVTRCAEAAGFKPVPTGIEHGTVTVIAGGIAHEITTFRRDIATDGRNATVAFSDCIEDDAQRRDFTMNALYADAAGVVLDPVGAGLRDLTARRVRFVGDAETRISEDYLRILRFFRFSAWYGEDLDADGLAACAALADGMGRLSRERVGNEMRKLLSANDPVPAVWAMYHAGILAQVLAGADPRALGPLVHLAPQSNWMTRLAAVSGGDVGSALRLSKAETKQVALLREAAIGTASAGALGYHLGAQMARDVMALRSALLEMPLSPDVTADIQCGAHADFPVKPADLMPVFQGPALGAKLKELEARWIESGFTLTRGDLL